MPAWTAMFDLCCGLARPDSFRALYWSFDTLTKFAQRLGEFARPFQNSSAHVSRGIRFIKRANEGGHHALDGVPCS